MAPVVPHRSPEYCVLDGPFANLGVSFAEGPPLNATIVTKKRCLERNYISRYIDQGAHWNKNVVPLLNGSTFAWFTNGVDHDAGNTGSKMGIHGMGHIGIGGEVCTHRSHS